jgi:hypothetical protein
MKLFSILLVTILMGASVEASQVTRAQFRAQALNQAILEDNVDSDNDAELVAAAAEAQIADSELNSQQKDEEKMNVWQALRAYKAFKRENREQARQFKQNRKRLNRELSNPDSEIAQAAGLVKELCKSASPAECASAFKSIYEPKFLAIADATNLSWLDRILPSAHASGANYLSCTNDLFYGDELSYHALLIGRTQYDCSNSTDIVVTNIGPGLHFGGLQLLVSVCALANKGLNVGVSAGVSGVAAGVSIGTYIGAGGLCIATGLNTLSVGAYAGLSFMRIKSDI